MSSLDTRTHPREPGTPKRVSAGVPCIYIYLAMVSTEPNLLMPGSQPHNQSIRVRIQSLPGNLRLRDGSYISPVQRRPAKIAFRGSPLPIFALIICFPSGVQKESLSLPAPLAAVDTEHFLSKRLPGKNFHLLGGKIYNNSLRYHKHILQNVSPRNHFSLPFSFGSSSYRRGCRLPIAPS